MLRLWPERLTVGLFPRQCWVRAGRRVERFDVPAQDDGWAPMAFASALQALRDIGAQGEHVDVILTDNVARCSLLPWQEQQLSEPQLRAYAQACFDRVGAGVDATWVLDAGYRRFRAPGLAVAVPRTLLEEFASIAGEYRMRLRSTTPLTSRAYWRYEPGLRSARDALFLHEADRLTLLRWEAGHVAALDVQPIAGEESGVALRRLVQRQPESSMPRVHVWAPYPDVKLSAAFNVHFPDASLRLSGPAWESPL